MKKIKLTQGKFAIISDVDVELTDQYKWYFMNNGYAATRPWNKENKSYRTVYLHRFLMGEPKNRIVDHINGNTLDNRRENLRECSHKENIRNGKIRSNNTSGHKGVYLHYDKKKWTAKIMVNYKSIHLGLFSNKEDAVFARIKASKKYFGEFS